MTLNTTLMAASGNRMAVVQVISRPRRQWPGTKR